MFCTISDGFTCSVLDSSTKTSVYRVRNCAKTSVCPKAVLSRSLSGSQSHSWCQLLVIHQVSVPAAFVRSLSTLRTWHIPVLWPFVVFALSVLSFFPLCLLNRTRVVEEKNDVFYHYYFLRILHSV